MADMSSLTTAIQRAAEPAAAAHGLVIESVRITPAGRRQVVTVVVDLPDDQLGAAELDAVADAARDMGEPLDALAELGEKPYVLEVTTPGVDRPLTARRHWLRARGRLVTVTTTGGQASGRLRDVTDEHVVLDVEGAAKEIAWQDIVVGRMEVEFNRPTDFAPDQGLAQEVDDAGIEDSDEYDDGQEGEKS